MAGPAFIRAETLIILGLGFLAICLDTVCGVLFGKLLYIMTGGKINPLIGAAGISAFPMAARVVAKVGMQYNKKNYLLDARHGRQRRRADRLGHRGGGHAVGSGRHGCHPLSEG